MSWTVWRAQSDRAASMIVGVGRLPAAVAVTGLRGAEDREDRRGVAGAWKFLRSIRKSQACSSSSRSNFFAFTRREKLLHRRGVERGIGAWAWHWWGAYQLGGTTLVRSELTQNGTSVHYLPCGVAGVGSFLAFSGNSP